MSPSEASPLHERPWVTLPGHLLIGLLRHSEDVWVHVTHVLPTVCMDDGVSVDGQLLVWVNGHQDDACGERAAGAGAVSPGFPP